MNTPKQKKRHHVVWEPDGTFAQLIQGETFHPGLSSPDHCTILAQITTEFEHLEDHFAGLLAEVSGTDRVTAQYIMRAVLAPRARTGLVRDLLQKAPRNISLGEEYDQAISEFDEARELRNLLVHGRWWTTRDLKIVMFTPTDEHAMWEFAKARVIGTDLLEYALYRTRRTSVLVTRLTIVQAPQRSQLEAVPPPDPPPTEWLNVLRRGGSKSTKQPRQPSPESPRKPKGARKLERKAKAAKAKRNE